MKNRTRAQIVSVDRSLRKAGVPVVARRIEIFKMGREDAGLEMPTFPITMYEEQFREIEISDGLVGLYKAGRGFWPEPDAPLPTKRGKARG